MEGRFLQGVLVGGILGAALISRWDVLSDKYPFLKELQADALWDKRRCAKGQKGSGAHTRTRLMARRHRVKAY